MNRKDVKLGAILAWQTSYSRDQRLADAASVPVEIVDLAREVPVMSRHRPARPAVQTGVRAAIFASGLTGSLRGKEFEVTPRDLNGTWTDCVERRAQRERDAAELEITRQAREDRLIAVHDRIGELSDPGLRRGMLDTRGRRSGHVDIDVNDLLALIKAARTAALNEYEGTGGRND
jgi:hypothetical protein